MDDTFDDRHSAHVATIAAAYLGNPSNPVEKNQIAEVIREIGTALRKPAEPEAPATAEVEKPSTAAVRKSITHDHLISFIDGKPYKSLKRHLNTKGFTPASYRERFGLKPDYPMTAPSYSAQRSELAKKAGLGQLTRKPATETAAPAPVAAVESAPVEIKAPAKAAAKPKAAPAPRKTAKAEAPAAAAPTKAAKPAAAPKAPAKPKAPKAPVAAEIAPIEIKAPVKPAKAAAPKAKAAAKPATKAAPRARAPKK